jgi:hypothetical protein
MRRAALAAALAIGLAGCPIPQPLPDYPAGTVTPPRILMDQVSVTTDGNKLGVTDGNPIIFVPAGCVTIAPSYDLAASVSDSNTIESIEARWFVNYDPRFKPNYTYPQGDTIPPNADATNLIRPVPMFTFAPYDFGPSPGAPSVAHNAPYPDPGILRVVELVVSNGFDPAAITTASKLPNKKPLASDAADRTFETQTYRWVFLSVPESLSAPCPH